MKLSASEPGWKRYGRKYPERRRQSCRTHYHKDIDAARASARQRKRRQYQLRREEILARNTSWRAANPDKIRIRDAKRRALLRAAVVNLHQTQAWMAAVLRKRFVRCYYCDSKISTKALHFDHIVPLSKGGLHCVENLCTSCEPCNLKKGTKAIDAWVRIGQQTFTL